MCEIWDLASGRRSAAPYRSSPAAAAALLSPSPPTASGRQFGQSSRKQQFIFTTIVYTYKSVFFLESPIASSAHIRRRRRRRSVGHFEQVIPAPAAPFQLRHTISIKLSLGPRFREKTLFRRGIVLLSGNYQRRRLGVCLLFRFCFEYGEPVVCAAIYIRTKIPGICFVMISFATLIEYMCLRCRQQCLSGFRNDFHGRRRVERALLSMLMN